MQRRRGLGRRARVTFVLTYRLTYSSPTGRSPIYEGGVEITGDDSLTKWLRARSAPPPVHELNVSFEEREEAKRIGCRWSPESKCWVLRTRGQLCEWAAKRLKEAPVAGV